jgi:hypothetical protein
MLTARSVSNDSPRARRARPTSSPYVDLTLTRHGMTLRNGRSAASGQSGVDLMSGRPVLRSDVSTHNHQHAAPRCHEHQGFPLRRPLIPGLVPNPNTRNLRRTLLHSVTAPLRTVRVVPAARRPAGLLPMVGSAGRHPPGLPVQAGPLHEQPGHRRVPGPALQTRCLPAASE